MSDKKEYSAVEVARKVLERVQEQLKKNEELLSKAKNTAHEIEAGQEPSAENAECPEYLASADMSGEASESQSEAPKKKKKPESEESESEEMEESDDSEESESEDESEESEYEFKKSESGMYTIEYKRLAKKEQKMKKMFGRPATSSAGGGTSAPPAPAPGTSIASQIGFGKAEDKKEDKKDKKTEDPKKEDQPLCGAPMDKADQAEGKKANPSFDREKKDVEWTPAQRTMIDTTRPNSPTNPQKSSRADQGSKIMEAKQRRDAYRKQGLLKEEVVKKCGDMKKEEVKETINVDFDKPTKSDKEKEQRKRPMEKCGDIEVGAKKAQKSDTCGIMKREKGVEKLGKFLAKGEKKIH